MKRDRETPTFPIYINILNWDFGSVWISLNPALIKAEAIFDFRREKPVLIGVYEDTWP